MLRRWAEQCPNVWIYNYDEVMLVSALTPVPRISKLRQDLPLMKKWGVIGFLNEGRNAWAEEGIATKYIRAKLGWKTDADVDALLAEFYARFSEARLISWIAVRRRPTCRHSRAPKLGDRGF